MDPNFARRIDDIEDRGLPGDHDQTLEDDVHQLWRDAPDWYALTELNRRYLEGSLPLCPSYRFPVEPETENFENLLALHDYGIISTNSCPGTGLGDTELRQRSFLFFNIPTRGLVTTSPDALPNFVRDLGEASEVYAHIRFQYLNAPHGIERDPDISRLMVSGSYNTLPKIDGDDWESEGWTYDTDERGHVCGFTFEQSKYLDDLDGDHTGDLRIPTGGSSFGDDESPIQASHMADPLQISVLARGSDWDFTGIGKLIKGLLDDSGILSAYRRP
ncbi:hypothetical protein INS49_005461 [Diaporthe citri]|uniref:uncharacterized protein n=1 Tax=Diaporthe citri TaxID=83186 RepID=UPI001C826DCE|nr:uncharacterized protein INS49_005461 [Diaporthe citri]KAG6353752.1 hypothetical protein INS49_005461 [Diaporthe citri]